MIGDDGYLPNPFDSILRAIGADGCMRLRESGGVCCRLGEYTLSGQTPIPHKREGTGGTPIQQVEGAMLCFGEGDIFRTIYSVYRLSKLF